MVFGILREHGLSNEGSENGSSRLLNMLMGPTPLAGLSFEGIRPSLTPYGRVLTQATLTLALAHPLHLCPPPLHPVLGSWPHRGFLRVYRPSDQEFIQPGRIRVSEKTSPRQLGGERQPSLSGANRPLLHLVLPLLARPLVGPAALRLDLLHHTRRIRTLIPRLPTGWQFCCARFSFLSLQ